MKKSSLSPSPRGFLLTPRSNDGDSQRVTVPDAAGSAAASTAGGLVGASAPTFEVTGRCMRGLALAACPELGPRRMQKSSMSPSPRSPRGFLLTPRSNVGDSQRVTVPNAAGSAAASTAGGLAPKVPVPGWDRGGCKDRCRHARRAFLLSPRPNNGDSQPVAVPDAAGSAAASTAGGLAPELHP